VPAFLTRPWALVSQGEAHAAASVGWRQKSGEPTRSDHTHVFSRGYLLVESVGGKVAFPQFNPFGKVTTG
jgi:hypothetical protein